jgi:GTP-binding protein LepA
MEIVQERLRREYQIDLIATTRAWSIHVLLENGELLVVDNPTPDAAAKHIAMIEEPYVLAHVLTPSEYLGERHEAVPGSARRST